MSPPVRELLDLVFRWMHLIAGIMWIGNSLLWNWLDRNLEPSKTGKEGIAGEIWLLHSGAFYFMEKDLRGWDRDRPLHWFKWQAYTTWLTGAALLVVVYYASGGALLIDPAVRELSSAAAIGIGAGTIVGGWLAYDLFLGRAVSRMGRMGAVAGLALVLAVAFGLTQVFSGRAAFLHVGALLGTLMAGNVFRVIMPAQRVLVSAVERGERPDPEPAKRAKDRSIHNNYMTFPVLVLMLSSHFPALYGHRWNWVVLGILVVTGAAVRHILNVRFGWPRWKPALAATFATSLGLLALLTARPAQSRAADGAGGGQVSFAQANAVIQKRCAVCHSADAADRTFGVAPAGVAFDTPEQIRSRMDRIRARAVETETMPPANKTHMTVEERALLGRWIAQGGRVD
ncbi:MAG: FIG137887: membrane protein related to purine degradation [uncultured Gemmatimonadetes bacterium]|uniref:FIG137887: membrane protein related to purine degradation n=1 Tax=uncultured Gemmatimonadota bacterium TaxID=203437 RepID=A0A6J4MWC0_9BACT|nr:MAG: FIG137887: membrane protein related to purine degradation [uncultured Gemmatimonadota bacterium]